MGRNSGNHSRTVFDDSGIQTMDWPGGTSLKVTDKNAKASKKDILYGWPHFLLWLLALVGLIRFNLGKTPTELFYGSVISFWLLSHLFNLTFALLFFVERPSYRSYERFKESYPLKFMLNGQLFTLKRTIFLKQDFLL